VSARIGGPATKMRRSGSKSAHWGDGPPAARHDQSSSVGTLTEPETEGAAQMMRAVQNRSRIDRPLILQIQLASFGQNEIESDRSISIFQQNIQYYYVKYLHEAEPQRLERP